MAAFDLLQGAFEKIHLQNFLSEQRFRSRPLRNLDSRDFAIPGFALFSALALCATGIRFASQHRVLSEMPNVLQHLKRRPPFGGMFLDDATFSFPARTYLSPRSVTFDSAAYWQECGRRGSRCSGVTLLFLFKDGFTAVHQNAATEGGTVTKCGYSYNVEDVSRGEVAERWNAAFAKPF